MWGEIETEPEVETWLDGLSTEEFAVAEFHLELLAERGVLLGEPDTRQLRGKLRELRFHLGREQTRVTYFIASGRRIILLTVFKKTRWRERSEVNRAYAAMLRCLAEGHIAEDDDR